jgi:hypothetical protein
MSNVSRPCGFYPAGPILRMRPYKAKGTIYRGDLVKRSAGSSDTDGADEIVAGTAGAALVGCALNYGVSGDTILVADHPDQELVGQADDASIASNAKIGLNYSLVDGGGSSSSHVSGMQIDASTFAGTATLELKVLRLLAAPDNALGAYAKMVCKINNHQLNGGTGAAGV